MCTDKIDAVKAFTQVDVDCLLFGEMPEATAQTVTVGTVHCCSVHALGPALSAEVFQRRPHSFPLSTE